MTSFFIHLGIGNGKEEDTSGTGIAAQQESKHSASSLVVVRFQIYMNICICKQGKA